MSPAATFIDALRNADLERLGFRPEDATDMRALIASLGSDDVDRISPLAATLRDHLDDPLHEHTFPTLKGPARLAAQRDLLLAVVAVAPEAHERAVARGLPPDLAWRSLADIGQQVHVFRTRLQQFGVTTAEWCADNLSGRHLWLGRLQFTLEADGDAVALGIHVPETGGPLTAAAVDDALAQAAHWYPRLFPQHRIGRWRIHSWLLNPRMLEHLRSDSNTVQFAARFDLSGERELDSVGHLFFCLGHDERLEPVDLGALPAETSLQRAAYQALLSHPYAYEGVLRQPPEPASTFPDQRVAL